MSIGPEYVGCVETEEEMEDHHIFYRPFSGKKVLVIDRKKNECFYLKWKTFNKDQRKGRELDPRYFDQLEKQKFDASDAKEWESFLKTNAVTVVPPHEAKKVPTDRIFKRPARMVRTDKNQMEGELHAKSRMVLPGDVDPDGEKTIGAWWNLYGRTDVISASLPRVLLERCAPPVANQVF